MAYCPKRSRVEKYDSNDSDFSLKLMEKTTSGMYFGKESELDHLFQN